MTIEEIACIQAVIDALQDIADDIWLVTGLAAKQIEDQLVKLDKLVG